MLCGLLQPVREKLEDDLLRSQRQVGLRIAGKAFWPSQDTIGKIGLQDIEKYFNKVHLNVKIY